MSSYMSRVSDDLLAKEEEYHRLNAEIEEKTKQLVEEVTNMSMERGDSKDIQEDQESIIVLSPEPIIVKNKLKSPNTFITNLQNNPVPSTEPSVDVLPAEARDLGPEATMRFLKAKVRVLEEEVERLTIDNGKQKQELSKIKQSLTTEKEENSKMQRNYKSLQTQLEKYTNLVDEKKKQNKILETDLIKTKKDVELMERSEKKSVQSQRTIEVRLDRALEEVEKYKGLLSAARSRASETNNFDKETVNNLSAENKILQKQKTELINAYKKQMKLIDVLRKQKLHFEASRMLNFTQEEFMKVLDWKNAH